MKNIQVANKLLPNNHLEILQLLYCNEVAGLTPLPSSNSKASDDANILDIFKEVDALEVSVVRQ